MTERKPPGIGFETWIDIQIREAADRGELDDLPGAGKPIPGQGEPDDEMWWVKDYIRREGLSTEALLPTPLWLRKQIGRLPEMVNGLRCEQAVRDVAESSTSGSWTGCGRRQPSGPQVQLTQANVDTVVEQWRAGRRVAANGTTACVSNTSVSNDQVTTDAAPPQRARWWRRGARQHRASG